MHKVIHKLYNPLLFINCTNLAAYTGIFLKVSVFRKARPVVVGGSGCCSVAIEKNYKLSQIFFSSSPTSLGLKTVADNLDSEEK